MSGVLEGDIDWPRCPICNSLLQPLKQWNSSDTREEIPWYCTNPLCSYFEYRPSGESITKGG